MPKLLFIAITNRCNRSCDYCPIKEWRNGAQTKDSLTLDFCKKTIEKYNPTDIEITGGEPTLVNWLDDLTDYLEEQKIQFVVKSNGYRKCKNQITAWHDNYKTNEDIPKNYDKILIIKDTHDWEAKVLKLQCDNIPYVLIGKDNDYRYYNKHTSNVQTLFLCPDKTFKTCHERHFGNENIEWKNNCLSCKSVEDYFLCI